MTITMESAIEKLLKEYNMSDCKTVSAPVVPSTFQNADSPGVAASNFPLRSLVGGLLYISTMARPDIAYSVQKLATYAHKPNEVVVKAGKRILAYLKGTKKFRYRLHAAE